MSGLAELLGVQTLDQIEEALKPKAAPKEFKPINFFKVEDGQRVFVRFLQEIDPDSENFNAEAGQARQFTWVQPDQPDGWKYRYVPTPNLEHRVSGWQWKTRLLINLVAVDADGEPVTYPEGHEREGEDMVFFWDTSKTNMRQLLEYNEDEGSITNRTFKIKRIGTGTETNYMILDKGEDGGIDVSKYVDDIVRPDDYLRELTPEHISRHEGDDADDEGEVYAGAWTG